MSSQSNHNVTGSLFLFVPVIIFGIFAIFMVFSYNYEEGIVTGKKTPPSAEGKKSSKPVVDLRTLAMDAGLAAKGKTLFLTNCASCHGATGHGDGDRAASLNPKPRNYSNEKFNFGDDIHSIYQTLQKGSPGTSMPSFALLPAEDVIAMAQYVRTLIPNAAPTTEEIANRFPAVDPAVAASAPGAPAKVTLPGDTLPRIPIQFAMQQIAKTQPVVKSASSSAMGRTMGAQIYTQRCSKCHGANGEGAAWKHISVAPYRYGVSAPLNAADAPWQSDRKLFGEIVTRGLPGDVMPGCGSLTTAELDDLYAHVKSFASRNP